MPDGTKVRQYATTSSSSETTGKDFLRHFSCASWGAKIFSQTTLSLPHARVNEKR